MNERGERGERGERSERGTMTNTNLGNDRRVPSCGEDTEKSIPSIQLYVAFHDDGSYVEAVSLCERWKMETESQNDQIRKAKSSENDSISEETIDDDKILKRKGQTPIYLRATPLQCIPGPYLESSLFQRISENDREWRFCDYVGVVTYSIERKLTAFLKNGKEFRINWVDAVNQALRMNVAVLGLFGMRYKKNGKDISLLEGSVFQHGLSFYLAWTTLLKKLGATDNDIHDPKLRMGFFCNWWVGSPSATMKYITIFNRATQIIENDEEMKYHIQRDALYGSGKMSKQQLENSFGKDYYTMHPFVLERLPAYFFQKHFFGGMVGTLNMFSMNLP